MATEPNTVHRLLVSDKAFEIMVRAIADHSMATRKFANLRDVVISVLDSEMPVSITDLQRYYDLGQPDGPTQVWLRLAGEAVNKLDAFREKISHASNSPCSIRDAVCFACLVSVKT